MAYQGSLLRTVHTLISNTSREEALAACKGLKVGRSSEDIELIDAAFDLYNSGIVMASKKPVQEKKHIVVALVHGIRTRAVWQEQSKSILQVEGLVNVYPIGFGFLDIFAFLGVWREGAENSVLFRIRDLIAQNRDSELVVVCHSFGTYVVTKILSKYPEIHVKRLLICGSIIDLNYRWDKLTQGFNEKNCINDVGTRDIFPVLAQIATLGYGCSGTFGFKNTRVFDRFFDYGHSDFFSDDHQRKYWLPFVLDGNIIKSPWNENRPSPSWLISFLGGMPWIKYAVFVIYVGLLYLISIGIIKIVNFFY